MAPVGGRDCDSAIEAIEARLAALAAGFGTGGGGMFGLAGRCFPTCAWLRETREPLKAERGCIVLFGRVLELIPMLVPGRCRSKPLGGMLRFKFAPPRCTIPVLVEWSVRIPILVAGRDATIADDGRGALSLSNASDRVESWWRVSL